jgi:hypothetical protein
MEGSVVFVVNLEHSVSVMVSQPGEPVGSDAPIRCTNKTAITLHTALKLPEAKCCICATPALPGGNF